MQALLKVWKAQTGVDHDLMVQEVKEKSMEMRLETQPVEEAGTKEVGKLMKQALLKACKARTDIDCYLMVQKVKEKSRETELCIPWNQMELDQNQTCRWMEVMVCIDAKDMDSVE